MAKALNTIQNTATIVEVMEKERVLLKELRESKNLCLGSRENIEEHVKDLETQYSKSSYATDEDIPPAHHISTHELPKEQGVFMYMQKHSIHTYPLGHDIITKGK